MQVVGAIGLWANIYSPSFEKNEYCVQCHIDTYLKGFKEFLRTNKKPNPLCCRMHAGSKTRQGQIHSSLGQGVGGWPSSQSPPIPPAITF